jgi:DNA (cytosine-5)-methyltransferase 1
MGGRFAMNNRFTTYTMDDVSRQSSKELFTVVSTFAGGGGSSTGYKLAGGKVLAANEFVPEAVETYKQNYPNTIVDSSDIRKITGSKKEGVLSWFRSFGVEQGELDILDGSPPCATFSKATGKREEDKEKHLAKNKKYSEVEQDRIGMLIHDYVYLANCILPKICILENVPEIRSSTVFHDALRRLRGSGYFVEFKRLKAHHYGVPQRRERMFVIGVRKDICEKIGIKEEVEIKKLFPIGSSYAPSVSDALSTLELNERDKQEIALIRQSIRKTASYEIIRAIPKNPARPSRLHEHYKGFKNFYFNTYRCAWGEPAPTITQSGNQLGGRGGICHPEEDRTYTIRELKRLSALPDDFKLTGTFNQQAERIGRMVPPLMTTAIAESLFENVLRVSQ